MFERALKVAFDAGLADAGSMTLHVGNLSVRFPAHSGGDSSFVIGNVDVSWTDGETLAARVSKPSATAVSTDAALATLTVSGATLVPDFDARVLVYRAEGDATTATVAATPADGGAAMAYGTPPKRGTVAAERRPLSGRRRHCGPHRAVSPRRRRS